MIPITSLWIPTWAPIIFRPFSSVCHTEAPARVPNSNPVPPKGEIPPITPAATGRHIYAIGSNVDAAKLSGVSVVKTTTKTYLVSAFCSFVVGLILCGQAGMGNMEAGNMYEMYAVAAGVIGGISPLGGT